MHEVIDNGVDHGKLAQIATEQFNNEALQRALASRTHNSTIIWRESGQSYMATWTGTASERVEYMIHGLRIDLDAGQWAAGYWDDKSQRWATCGTSMQLRLQIESLPIPR